MTKVDSTGCGDVHSQSPSFSFVLAYPPHSQLMTMMTRISYNEFSMSVLLAHSWPGICQVPLFDYRLELLGFLETDSRANCWAIGNYCAVYVSFSMLGKRVSFCFLLFPFPFHSPHDYLSILPGILDFPGNSSWRVSVLAHVCINFYLGLCRCSLELQSYFLTEFGSDRYLHSG